MTITDHGIDPTIMEALQRFIAETNQPVEAPAIPDAIAAQARELDDLRSAIKVMKEREETIRASLLDFLKTEGVDSVAEGGVAISQNTYERANIDRKRMEALYPKVLADCETKTPVTQVRVKIKG